MDQDDDDERHWYDDDRLYSSSRDSDDSPLLSHRIYEKRRYAPYPVAKVEEREKRSTVSLLMKFFLFCTAMIMFCVLLYIPVYSKASYQIPKALVVGWPQHINRDTKLYVLPNNVTIIQEPTDICTKTNKKLLLLIVVCSATENFEQRVAIRSTWGDHKKYKELNKIFNLVRERYKNYNFTYDLYASNSSREKREASGISRLLPEIAKALQSNLVNGKTDSAPEEKRFDDDDDVKNDVDVKNEDDVKNGGDVKDGVKNDGEKGDDDLLQEFGMNQEFGERNVDYEDDYVSNIMKIPPKGYEDSPDLEKVLNLLRNDKNFPKIKDDVDEKDASDVEFKLVFLLGLPVERNDSTVQEKIEQEVEKYGDVIQEGFIDSYNNLTLKSIMMLKWINNKCNESVRYVLKTDDDMYVNVPNLIANLKNRSQEHDTKRGSEKEYLLIGDLICGARPVLDTKNKWYSPRYMYGGRMYPKYLSGTGYVFSVPAAKALYGAALVTPYFHLEDIYITGICALRASPPLAPRDDPSFSYRGGARSAAACLAHARATLHRIPPRDMSHIRRALSLAHTVDICERKRLTQI